MRPGVAKVVDGVVEPVLHVEPERAFTRDFQSIPHLFALFLGQDAKVQDRLGRLLDLGYELALKECLDNEGVCLEHLYKLAIPVHGKGIPMLGIMREHVPRTHIELGPLEVDGCAGHVILHYMPPNKGRSSVAFPIYWDNTEFWGDKKRTARTRLRVLAVRSISLPRAISSRPG